MGIEVQESEGDAMKSAWKLEKKLSKSDGDALDFLRTVPDIECILARYLEIDRFYPSGGTRLVWELSKLLIYDRGFCRYANRKQTYRPNTFIHG